jgi:Ca2+-binding EF-hand superfamily protein
MKPVQPVKLLLALALAAPASASAQPPEEGRRDGDRPAPEQREGERQEGERREGDRPEGDRREPDRPPGERRERPEGGRPEGERPEAGRRGAEGRPPGGQGFGGPQDGRGFRGMFPNPLLAAIDKNGDGELSEEEIDGAIIALKTLDRNRDRRLDASELRPNMEGMPGQFGRGGMPGGGGFFQGPGGFPQGEPGGGRGGNNQGGPGAMLERMLAMDANGDGKLSADELPERMKPMLERSDANRDGALDRGELQAMAAQRLQQPGQGGPEGGRPPGGGNPAEFFGQMMERADVNKDGKLSGDELPPFLREQMEALDKNKDGGVDREELQSGMAARMREGRPPGREMREQGDRPEGGAVRPRRPDVEVDGEAKPEGERSDQPADQPRPESDREDDDKEKKDDDK